MSAPTDVRTGEAPRGNDRTGPDLTRLAGVLTRAWLEARCGHRPIAQLEPYVAPTVMARLRHQTARQRRRPVPSVRRVTARQPAPGVCEAVVTVTWDSGRVTSVAIRLERQHGRWRAVEITPPESGLRPAASTTPPAAWADGADPRPVPASPGTASGLMRRGSA